MDCNLLAYPWPKIKELKLFINAIYGYKQQYLKIEFIIMQIKSNALQKDIKFPIGIHRSFWDPWDFIKSQYS